MVHIRTFIALSFTITEALSFQVCGKNLANMLDLVCKGRGFHWTQMDGESPTISKRTAVQYFKRSLTSHKSKHSGGIVYECCRKSCTVAHMETYCAASPGTYYPNPTGAPMSPEMADELMKPFTTEIPTTTTTTQKPKQITQRPPSRPLSPFAANRLIPYGAYPKPSFFFVRLLADNRPTRTPTTRLNMHQ